MERLYNIFPYKLQKIKSVKTDTINNHLDRWLRDIPDTPKIDNNRASVSAEMNIKIKQKKNNR